MAARCPICTQELEDANAVRRHTLVAHGIAAGSEGDAWTPLPGPPGESGWHPDPWNSTLLRYWDGSQWSGKTAALGSAPGDENAPAAKKRWGRGAPAMAAAAPAAAAPSTFGMPGQQAPVAWAAPVAPPEWGTPPEQVPPEWGAPPPPAAPEWGAPPAGADPTPELDAVAAPNAGPELDVAPVEGMAEGEPPDAAAPLDDAPAPPPPSPSLAIVDPNEWAPAAPLDPGHADGPPVAAALEWGTAPPAAPAPALGWDTTPAAAAAPAVGWGEPAPDAGWNGAPAASGWNDAPAAPVEWGAPAPSEPHPAWNEPAAAWAVAPAEAPATWGGPPPEGPAWTAPPPAGPAWNAPPPAGPAWNPAPQGAPPPSWPPPAPTPVAAAGPRIPKPFLLIAGGVVAALVVVAIAVVALGGTPSKKVTSSPAATSGTTPTTAVAPPGVNLSEGVITLTDLGGAWTTEAAASRLPAAALTQGPCGSPLWAHDVAGYHSQFINGGGGVVQTGEVTSEVREAASQAAANAQAAFVTSSGYAPCLKAEAIVGLQAALGPAKLQLVGLSLDPLPIDAAQSETQAYVITASIADASGQVVGNVSIDHVEMFSGRYEGTLNVRTDPSLGVDANALIQTESERMVERLAALPPQGTIVSRGV